MTKEARRHAGLGTVAKKKHVGKIMLCAQIPWIDRDSRYEFRDWHEDDYGYTALRIIVRDDILRVQFRADRERAFGDICDWDDFDTFSKLLFLEGLEAAARPRFDRSSRGRARVAATAARRRAKSGLDTKHPADIKADGAFHGKTK